MPNTDRPLTISDYKDCWYVAGETHIVDLIHPVTGLTMHFKRDAADVQAQHPTARRISWDEASRQIDAATDARFKQGVSEITVEQFEYALNVLPPVGWTTHAAVESFRMSERTWGTLTGIYARLGRRYFTLVDDIRTPAADIAARVAAFAQANPTPNTPTTP